MATIQDYLDQSVANQPVIPTYPRINVQPSSELLQQINDYNPTLEAARRMTGLGTDSQNELSKIMSSLTPSELENKFGTELATKLLEAQAKGAAAYGSAASADRSPTQTLLDSAIGATSTFASGIANIGALTAGMVDPNVGADASSAITDFTKWTQGLQSDGLNQRRMAAQIRTQINEQDSQAKFNKDVAAGVSETKAEMSKIGRDTVASFKNTISDSTMLASGTADAMGSLLSATATAYTLKAIGRAALGGATRVAAIGASGGAGAKAINFFDKATWPIVIAATESGSTYTQAVQDVLNTPLAVMNKNPKFIQLVQESKAKGLNDNQALVNAYQIMANDVALPAAGKQAPIAAALGTFTRFGEKPFSVPTVGTGFRNVRNELGEETGQGGASQLLINNELQNQVNPDVQISRGLGDNLAQSAIFGTLAAAVVQAPGLPGATLRSIVGTADKLITAKADAVNKEIADASPVSAKAVTIVAKGLQVNAAEVKTTLDTAINAVPDATPEDIQAGLDYSNKVIESMNLNLDQETLDSMPAPILDIVNNSSNNRAVAVIDIANHINQSTDPTEQLHAAYHLYDLMQPIADLNANKPEILSKLAKDDPAHGVLTTYDSLSKIIGKSDVVKQAIKTIHDALEKQNGADLLPISDTEILTPEGQVKAKSIITAARIAPDLGNAAATQNVLKHAENGQIVLTDEEINILKTSLTLLNAREKYNKQKELHGLTPMDVVSTEITTDRNAKIGNAKSASQYSEQIIAALRVNDDATAADLLGEMRLFLEHMVNKVKALNEHAELPMKAPPVSYMALNPVTREFYPSTQNSRAAHKGMFISNLHNSLKLAQSVELEQSILGDVFNSFVDVFPQLGIKKLDTLQLPAKYSGLGDSVAARVEEVNVKAEPIKDSFNIRVAKADLPELNKIKSYLSNQKSNLDIEAKLALVNKAIASKEDIAKTTSENNDKFKKSIATANESTLKTLERTLIKDIKDNRVSDPKAAQDQLDLVQEALAKFAKKEEPVKPKIEPKEDTIDVVAPLVSVPEDVYVNPNGVLSPRLLSGGAELKNIVQAEEKRLDKEHKYIEDGTSIDGLRQLTSPITSYVDLGFAALKYVKAALTFNVSLSAMWAIRHILSDAYASVQETHQHRLANKSGDYYSFRAKDDPKYANHQAILDERRTRAEQAIVQLKQALVIIDKAILEKSNQESTTNYTTVGGVVTLSDQSDDVTTEAVQATASKEANAAIKQARDAVRKLLIQLNFKFVESPDVNLTQIERIASKYLTGLYNDDSTFLKEAALALSYALYVDVNEGLSVKVSRESIEKYLFEWLLTGATPKAEVTIWQKILSVFKALLSAFSSKEFTAIEDSLEDVITKIVTGHDFSFKVKEGYDKLVFQTEMSKNPEAVKVLLSMTSSGIPFTLTGSVAYADQVPVYRLKDKPLHDVDLIIPKNKVQAAYEWFKTGGAGVWGDYTTLYNVNTKDAYVIGVAVVPHGYKITNAKSGWDTEKNAAERSYDVYDRVSNEKVGSYYFLAGETETFEGIAGVTVDLIGDNRGGVIDQVFTDDTGAKHTIKVASYVGGFAAKLDMMRPKDIQDYKAVIGNSDAIVGGSSVSPTSIDAVTPEIVKEPVIAKTIPVPEYIREALKALGKVLKEPVNTNSVTPEKVQKLQDKANSLIEKVQLSKDIQAKVAKDLAVLEAYLQSTKVQSTEEKETTLDTTEAPAEPVISEEAKQESAIKPEFVGKIILAHAGTGKSFAAETDPNIIDGDVLYYKAVNTVVDKYNKSNSETVATVANVSEVKNVFTEWGEYDTSNPARQEEAKKRRNEVYAEYAKQARVLADKGFTVLSSSIRQELIGVADIVVIQDDAAFIANNLTSSLRVNQNSETDLGKVQGKIDKAKTAAAKNPNLKVFHLKQGEYISALIFENTEEAKETVFEGDIPITFSSLVQGVKNMFLRTFTQPDEKKNNLAYSESPIADLSLIIESQEAFEEIAPNSKFALSDEIIKEYNELLTVKPDLDKLAQQLVQIDNLERAKEPVPDLMKLSDVERKSMGNIGGLLATVNAFLQDYLNGKTSKNSTVTLAELLTEGKEVNRWSTGKALNIVDNVDGVYKYNTNLMELAALAAMQWLLSSPQNVSKMSTEEVSQYTGIAEENLTYALINRVNAGFNKDQAANSLASKIMEYWSVSGTKVADEAYVKGIPQAVALELINAMSKLGLVTIDEITITPVDGLAEGTAEVTKPLVIQRIIPVEQTGDIMAFPTLIDEAVLVKPEPQYFFNGDVAEVPKTKLKSDIPNSPAEQKAIKNEQETPFYLNKYMFAIYNAMGLENLKLLFGGGPVTVGMNINHAKTLESKNKAAVAAYNHLTNTVAQLNNVASKIEGANPTLIAKRGRYNMTAVARMQMLGTYTEQGTKLLREAFLTTWSTLNLVENEDHSNAFKLALAQGLGLKIHNLGLDNSIKEVTELLHNKDKLAPAVELITEWMTDHTIEDVSTNTKHKEFNGAQLSAIFKEAGVEFTALALHSLMEYSRYKLADEAGKSAFRTALYVEADGVTNGPINAIMMMTQGDFTAEWVRAVEKGGLSFGEPKAKHLLDNVDLYSLFANNTKKELGKLKDAINLQKNKYFLNTHNSLVYQLMAATLPGASYTGDQLTVDRSLMKNPLTVIIYGSGKIGVAGKLTTMLVERIYEMISDASLEKDLQKRSVMEANINNLLDTIERIKSNNLAYHKQKATYFLANNTDVNSVLTKDTRGDLAQFTFDPKTVNAITKNILGSFAEPMANATITTVGSGLIATTDKIKLATQIQSTIYGIKIKNAIQEKIALRAATDPNFRKGDYISKADLLEIYDRFSNFAPIVNASPDQKLLVAKKEKFTTDDITTARSLRNDFRISLDQYLPTNAGVSAVPFLTIGAGDGYMMIKAALDKTNEGSFKIFDGMNMPLDKIKEQSESANKAARQAWDNNPVRGVRDAFSIMMTEGNLLNDNETVEAIALILNQADINPVNDEQYNHEFVFVKEQIVSLQTQLKFIVDSIDARHHAIGSLPNSTDQMAAANSPSHNGKPIDESLTRGSRAENDAAIATKLNQEYQKKLQELQGIPSPKVIPVKATPQSQKITEAMLNGAYETKAGAKKITAGILRKLIGSVTMTKDQLNMLLAIINNPKINQPTIIVGNVAQINAYRADKNTQVSEEPLSDDDAKALGIIDIASNTIFINTENGDPSIETVLHEMIHSATFSKVLEHYEHEADTNLGVNDSPETKETRKVVATAISNIEQLLNEFMSIEINTTNAYAAKAVRDLKATITNIKLRGLDKSLTPEQVKAQVLNEFMAWSLANPNIGNLLQKTKTKVTLLGLASTIIEGIKKILWGASSKAALKSGETILQALQFNTKIILNAELGVEGMISANTLHHSATGSVSSAVIQLREMLENRIISELNVNPSTFQGTLNNLALQTLFADTTVLAQSVGAEFNMSMEEMSSLQLIVAALSTEIHLDPLSMDKLSTVYIQAMKELEDQVSKGNFPKSQYDVLVGKSGPHKEYKGKTTMLPVFLGVALMDDNLRDVLSKINLPAKNNEPRTTWDAKLAGTSDDLFGSLENRITRAGQANTVMDAIDLMTRRIHEVGVMEHSRIVNALNQPGKLLDTFNDKAVNMLTLGSDKAVAYGNKLTTSQSPTVKKIGAMVATVSAIASEENSAQVSRAVTLILNQTKVWKTVRSLFSDIVGRTGSNAIVYDMIKRVRAGVQQIRQNFKDKVPKVIAKKFTRTMTKAEWGTMFRGIGKTDLAALVDKFGKDVALEILSDRNTRNKAILAHERAIQKLAPQQWTQMQAKMKQLANHMNTGIAGVNLLRNPYAIKDLSIKNSQSIPDSEVHLFDELISMYAVDSLDVNDLNDLASLVQDESEGLGFMLDYLVGQTNAEFLKASANPDLKYNYYKGYVPTVSKQGSVLKVAPNSEYTKLVTQGYSYVGDYIGSSIDSLSEPHGYYFSPVSARTAFSQGILQNISSSVGGVETDYGFTLSPTAGRIYASNHLNRVLGNLNKEVAGTENLMPVFDRDGEIIAMERSMDPEKVALLEQSDHLAEMIGIWRGRQVEESMSAEINKEAIDNVNTMYRQDLLNGGKQSEYVNIMDKKQLDKIERDAVHLFTRETLNYITDNYNDEFWVRKDMLDSVIGYRKASVADVFTGNHRLTKETETTIRNGLLAVFGKDAYRKVAKYERIQQDLVSDARTLIAVKSVVVPMFNFVSNTFQLIARGVPIATIVRKFPIVTLELRNYARSRIKQVELEAELRAATGNPLKTSQLQFEIKAIQDGHRRLSIWPLIEAGEFSAISDVGTNADDIDLFEGKSDTWFSSKVAQLSPKAQTMARYMFISKDTALFQAMQKSVQYGDFIAKATLYEHLTVGQKMSKEEALGRITDEFVNYDKLPGRGRGYAEDMGLLWFFNYKLRILKVAMSILRNNPVHLMKAMAIPMPVGTGTPVGDNIVTKIMDGTVFNAIGPGMGINAPFLNPVYNVLN